MAGVLVCLLVSLSCKPAAPAVNTESPLTPEVALLNRAPDGITDEGGIVSQRYFVKESFEEVLKSVEATLATDYTDIRRFLNEPSTKQVVVGGTRNSDHDFRSFEIYGGNQPGSGSVDESKLNEPGCTVFVSKVTK